MANATINRPKMTAREAKTFERESLQNMATVYGSLECECEPYADVFTYNRWSAQGFQVRKGSKGITIPVVKLTSKVDADTGEETESRKLLGRSWVFCRCQVDSKRAG